MEKTGKNKTDAVAYMIQIVYNLLRQDDIYCNTKNQKWPIYCNTKNILELLYYKKSTSNLH